MSAHSMVPPLCEVTQADCLEAMAALPDDVADHVITDPPYSEYTHRKVSGGIPRDAKTGAEQRRVRGKGFDAIDEATMTECARQFARIAKRWVLVFTDPENIGAWIDALTDAGLDHVRVGVWIKENAAPQFSGDRPATAFEAVVIAHRKGKKRWNGGGRRALWSVPIVINRDKVMPNYHPTQKPQELMEALVRDFTDAGDVVCDPFSGSGTTGVACKRLGRGFIGFEKQQKFADVARKRIADTQTQLSLLEQSA